MPTLSIPNTFTPFTKMISAQMNANFTAITTLLNTTKLDDTNIQNAGITPTTKLNQTGSSAGQFLASTGSAVIWAANPLTSQFNVIFGSAAQVTAGTATHSAFSAWTQASGDRVLILPGYTESASWSLTQKILIQGLGNTSRITGSLTLASGSSNSLVRQIRISAGLTINSGVDGCIIRDIWFPAGQTFTDNATALANILEAMVES